MRSVVVLILSSSVLLAANCERVEPAAPDPVVVPPDPLPTPVEGDPEPEPEKPPVGCFSACLNLRVHGCEVAADTPEGSKCEEICENSFQIPALAWDVDALTTTEVCPL